MTKHVGAKCQHDISNYFSHVFEGIRLVADGAGLAGDALPERGRQDLARQLLRVVEASRVN
jgi:hypothetical protein